MSLTSSFPLQLRRRLGLAWLLLALLLAPTLGRMHQVLHAPVMAPAVEQAIGLAAQGDAHPWAQADPGSAGQQALDMLHALFAGHSGADCQVLDQHTQLGAGFSVFALALPTLPQAVPAGTPLCVPDTRRTAAFHARAPPLSV
ncbi:MAG TPA: hypothetical protein PLL92_02215 [Alicycliphilus sp.]|nr:hypothetical protein [Alicycliphilus sp.]